jgi:divalent metal cation (Fe/Co/Zn/Cd) transporter
MSEPDPARTPAEHSHEHEHGGSRIAGLRHRVGHVLVPHSHDAGDKVDAAMETSREGIRTLWISLATLGATAAVQAVIVALSGSVALLGDTIHNAADALTAVPLGVAFVIGRRPATRRYTYGYGRAEDLAGIVIVLVIAASSGLAAYEAIDRLVHPRQVSHLWAVALAALDGVRGVGPVRMRWIGHALRAEADIVVDVQLTVVQAHELAVAAEHALIHALPRLTAATVHTDHLTAPGLHDPHEPLAHHAPDG